MRLLASVIFLSMAAGGAHAGAARCWLDHGAIVVTASFGDIAGDFILDASAPQSLLHLTRAQEDGIVAFAAVRPLFLAGKRIARFDMKVADLDARTRDFETTINGVFGTDVLREFVTDINFGPCRITLHRRAPKRSKGAVRMSLRMAGGVPVMRAAISDGARSRTGLFTIDTSHATSLIADAALSRPAAAGATGRLRALSVAGELFEQIPAGVVSGGGAPGSGSIGTAVWSRWSLRLDLRRQYLELRPRAPQ